MKNFLSKFKIPTLLGLTIIILGIFGGVYLTLQNQTFISKASPDIRTQNLTIANISDDSVNISWQTSTSSVSFVSFGLTSANEQTVLDDRDSKTPKAHLIHYMTIKNLLPKTNYFYKITSGKFSETGKFTTAVPLNIQSGFRPIIGSVLNGDIPLDEGIAYLSIADANVASALIRDNGNFLIPISQIRKSDLSEGFPLEDETTATLTIISARGEAKALFKLKDVNKGLPTIKLGENLDLTISKPVSSLDYDLNSDGVVNSTDNSILLQNFGNNPKNEQSSTMFKKADLNSDGVVDQKDLDLMSKQINQ